MNETGPTPEPAPKKRTEWNAVAAIIAALIGLLALGVSGYTAMLQREQVRADHLDPRERVGGAEATDHRDQQRRFPSN